ncbi:unnamed protein product [Arabis nemorensis]|uniref:Reverse transcriptase zinc-binding domain-containing protein n=1 Tax=Arabis nemorensis TaxID=586526 RepID=A0A565CSM5_9BRAS|nr:unnamed protein product [Arabis nemorensis]
MARSVWIGNGMDTLVWSEKWIFYQTPRPPNNLPGIIDLTLKLKHFLWRALVGALAVAEKLQSRGIAIDPTCLSCLDKSGSICHVLFHCHTAREVWELSGMPLPSAGFSRTSVMLNFYHLLKCSKNQHIKQSTRLAIPRLLWHLWKARNKVVFEKVRYDPLSIFNKAKDESTIWLNINSPPPIERILDDIPQNENHHVFPQV